MPHRTATPLHPSNSSSQALAKQTRAVVARSGRRMSGLHFGDLIWAWFNVTRSGPLSGGIISSDDMNSSSSMCHFLLVISLEGLGFMAAARFAACFFALFIDGNTLYNELEVVEGMKLDKGYISPYFITDQKSQKCELNDPLILIHDKRVSNAHSVARVMELAMKKQKPLLIVADVESDALSTLILNKLRGGFKVCAVKAPGFGESRKANLQDLAILTGGEVITEELGMNLENFEPQMFGTCKKVTISKNDTIILDGAGDKKAIEERAEHLRSVIEQSTSDYDKEKLQDRLAKLSGGIAVLKIGGASEVEVSEKKDRVTDALNATKAAVEEGIVPGGGVALLYASKDLDTLETANFDQKIGVQIIQNALKTPVHTIASNAGVEGAVIVGKLLEQENIDLGYDAAKGEYVDMVKAGIIDPLKVIRTALLDAASVSSLLTTTESVIVEIPKGESSASAMGSMDGMEY